MTAAKRFILLVLISASVLASSFLFAALAGSAATAGTTAAQHAPGATAIEYG
jgi:hypothetical protein